jgi:hypothetical protein
MIAFFFRHTHTFFFSTHTHKKKETMNKVMYTPVSKRSFAICMNYVIRDNKPLDQNNKKIRVDDDDDDDDDDKDLFSDTNKHKNYRLKRNKEIQKRYLQKMSQEEEEDELLNILIIPTKTISKLNTEPIFIGDAIVD